MGADLCPAMNRARSKGARTIRFHRRESIEMKMNAIEKHFVNGPGHTRRAAHRARQLLDRIDIQAARRYLDVGCGVGAAACEIAARCGLDVTGIDVDLPICPEASRRGGLHALPNHPI